MFEARFAESDACRWIVGAADRDPDEVVGANAWIGERAGSGADCQSDTGAALSEIRISKL